MTTKITDEDLKRLIRYHQHLLPSTRHLLDPATIFLILQTITALELYQRLRLDVKLAAKEATKQEIAP